MILKILVYTSMMLAILATTCTSPFVLNTSSGNCECHGAVTSELVLMPEYFVKVVSGKGFSLGLLSNNSVLSWGRNDVGQLGLGDYIDRHRPTLITSLMNVDDIAAGEKHALAVMGNNIYTWGNNTHGQLGTGDTTSYANPIIVMRAFGYPLIGNRVFAGAFHSFALDTNNNLYAFGANDHGQLGVGDFTTRLSPVQVDQAYTDVTAGSYHTLAKHTSGAIYGWGSNAYSELDLPGGDITSPTPIPSFSEVTLLSAGEYTSFMYNTSGLYAWGKNDDGRLGTGNVLTITGQTLVKTSIDIIVLNSKYNQTFFLITDGTIYRLNVNSTTFETFSHPLFTSVSAGYDHGIAMTADGKLHTWGQNTYGQLATGDTIALDFPTPIPDIFNAIDTHHCGAGLTIYNLTSCQCVPECTPCPDGTTLNPNDCTCTPVFTACFCNATCPVESILNTTNCVCNPPMDYFDLLLNTSDLTCACNKTLPTDGLLNISDCMCNKNCTDHICTKTCPVDHTLNSSSCACECTKTCPVDYTLNSSSCACERKESRCERIYVKKIAVGSDHSLALLTNGSIYSWGSNEDGQLGLGNKVTGNTPILIPTLSNVTSLTAGSLHSLALLTNGSVYSWGYNGLGQLGLGSFYGTHIAPQLIPSLLNVISIVGGSGHSLALLTNGSVYSWGNNGDRQLGLGDTVTKNTPMLIPILNNVVGIAAGGSHSLALLANGSVYSWGNNDFGQLGLGNTDVKNIPILIPSLSNVVGITTGAYHSLALLANGTVYSWGRNNYGQLGLGNTDVKNIPTLIPTLSNVKSLAAGGYYSIAILASEFVYSWGRNVNGQLGVSDTTNRLIPTLISGLTNVKSLVAGTSHSLALLTNGSVYSWGNNGQGQLGLGFLGNTYSTPQAIPTFKMPMCYDEMNNRCDCNIVCPSGTSQPLREQPLCIDCLVGEYQPYRNQSKCITCPRGHYCLSQVEIKRCEPKSYQSEIDSVTCNNCPRPFDCQGCNIYIADSVNRRIIQLSLSNAYKTTLFKNLSVDIVDMTVDSRNTFYLVTADYHLLSFTGLNTPALIPGSFDNIHSVAVDAFDIVYVADENIVYKINGATHSVYYNSTQLIKHISISQDNELVIAFENSSLLINIRREQTPLNFYSYVDKNGYLYSLEGDHFVGTNQYTKNRTVFEPNFKPAFYDSVGGMFFGYNQTTLIRYWKGVYVSLSPTEPGNALGAFFETQYQLIRSVEYACDTSPFRCAADYKQVDGSCCPDNKQLTATGTNGGQCVLVPKGYNVMSDLRKLQLKIQQTLNMMSTLVPSAVPAFVDLLAELYFDLEDLFQAPPNMFTPLPNDVIMTGLNILTVIKNAILKLSPTYNLNNTRTAVAPELRDLFLPVIDEIRNNSTIFYDILPVGVVDGMLNLFESAYLGNNFSVNAAEYLINQIALNLFQIVNVISNNNLPLNVCFNLQTGNVSTDIQCPQGEVVNPLTCNCTTPCNNTNPFCVQDISTCECLFCKTVCSRDFRHDADCMCTIPRCPNSVCPANSQRDSVGCGCTCDIGYVKNGDICCVGNSTTRFTMINSCEVAPHCYGIQCKGNNVKQDPVTCKCSCLTKPEHGKNVMSYNRNELDRCDVKCDTGYVLMGNKCCHQPEHSHFTGTLCNWDCNWPYIKHNNKCIERKQPCTKKKTECKYKSCSVNDEL